MSAIPKKTRLNNRARTRANPRLRLQNRSGNRGQNAQGLWVMKRLLILAIAVIFCSPRFALAQEAQKSSTAGRVNAARAVQLSPEQRERIRAIVMGKLGNLEETAADLGYTVNVGSLDAGLDGSLTKQGKTAAGHGLLGVRWDERETITLRYLPTDSGFEVADVQRVIENKPPVGDWRVVAQDSEVPARIWAAAPKS